MGKQIESWACRTYGLSVRTILAEYSMGKQEAIILKHWENVGLRKKFFRTYIARIAKLEGLPQNFINLAYLRRGFSHIHSCGMSFAAIIQEIILRIKKRKCPPKTIHCPEMSPLEAVI